MGDDRRHSDDMTADPGTESLPDAVHSPQLNPQAMAAADLARLLSAAGGVAIDADEIESDVDAGAPTNADGSINLVLYVAWLVERLAAIGRGTSVAELDGGESRATPQDSRLRTQD